MALSTFASAASKELTAVIRILRELIRVDQLIGAEIDKRQIRKLRSDLRVLYFEPTGVVGSIREFLANSTRAPEQLSQILDKIRKNYRDEADQVALSLKRVRSLNTRKNLEISLDLYEFTWRSQVRKDKVRRQIGSVLEYALNDADNWYDPKVAMQHFRVVVKYADKLNSKMAELDKKLKELT